MLEVNNLDDLAKELDINASTLRGRKARASIPYEKIVQKLDFDELVYVFKDKKLDELIKVSNFYEDKGLKKTNLIEVERSLDELTQTIEQGPFSRAFKIRLVATVMRIAGEDFKDLQKELQHTVIEE